MARPSCSTARTERPSRNTRSRRCRRCSGFATCSSALAWPAESAPHLDVLLELRRELEQPQVVGDRRAVEAHPPADFILRQSLIGEGAKGEGELDGVQVVTLHVLDERELESVFDLAMSADRRRESSRAQRRAMRASAARPRRARSDRPRAARRRAGEHRAGESNRRVDRARRPRIGAGAVRDWGRSHRRESPSGDRRPTAVSARQRQAPGCWESGRRYRARVHFSDYSSSPPSGSAAAGAVGSGDACASAQRASSSLASCR